MQEIALAGIIAFDELGRMLLIHRATPTRKQWETPGGKAEAGEFPEECAKREVVEELGVVVRIIKPLGKADFTEGEKNHSYHWFQAELLGKPEIKEKETFDGLRYFSWKELKEIHQELSANAKKLLEAYEGSRLGT